MEATFISELRKNAKPAFIAAIANLALATVLGFVLGGTHPFAEPVLEFGPIPIMAIFGCPACGVVLGYLLGKSRANGRGDEATSWGAFWKKAGAALVLYLLAAGMPLLGVTVWAAMPGHVPAPFVWGMVLPLLAYFTVGVVWLAAGMLMSARQARWVGSRLLVLGAAVVVSIHAMSWGMTWGRLYAESAIAIVGLLFAAGGAFVAGGKYETQPWPTRMLQMAAIGAGAGVCIAFAMNVSEGILAERLPYPTPVYPPSYELDGLGRVIRHDWRDIDMATNRPVPGDIQTKDIVSTFASARRPIYGPLVLMHYVWSFRRLPGPMMWYFVPARRTIEAFDPATGRYAGSLGPSGFSPASEPAQPFDEELAFALTWQSDPLIVYTSRAVWILRTGDAPATRVLYSARGDDRILGVTSPYQTTAPTSGVNLIVACRESVSLVKDGVETVRIPVSLPLAGLSTIQVASLGEGGYAALVEEFAPSSGEMVEAFRLRADRRGKILGCTDYPPLPQYREKPTTSEHVVLAIEAPPGLVIARSLIGLDPPGRARWPVGVALGMGLVAALAGRVLMRLYRGSAAAAWGWTIFCFFLSIAGILILVGTRTIGVTPADP